LEATEGARRLRGFGQNLTLPAFEAFLNLFWEEKKKGSERKWLENAKTDKNRKSK
jgi:hypothetical protein